MSKFVSGNIAGDALTGSFQDVIASSAFADASGGRAAKLAIITSDLGSACLISFGDTANPVRLPGGSAGFVLDLGASGLESTGPIQAKHDGAASAAGTKLWITLVMR